MIRSCGKAEEIRERTSVVTNTKLRPVVLALILGILGWWSSPVVKLDNVWSDFLLTCQAKPFNGNVIALAITAEDVIDNGQERLSREFLAEILNLLDREGVKRVLLDFNLGARVTPSEEVKLKEAMKGLGPNRLAMAYEPDKILRAPASLLQYATVVDLAFTADSDGRLRVMNKYAKDSKPNPCIWLYDGTSRIGPTDLDLRLDPSSVWRFSLKETYGKKYPQGFFQDKLVVISFDRHLSKTRANLPIHGPMDRGSIIAMGTETLINRYDLRLNTTSFILFFSHLVFVCCGYLIGAQTPNTKRALWGGAWVAGLVVAISWNFSVFYGVPTRPGTNLLASSFALYFALAHRLRVIELIGGLLSGVSSPEEVWLWRLHGERPGPVVLFDAMGHIKRANAAAITEFGLVKADFGDQTSYLARHTMPNIGERCESMKWSGGSGPTVWKLDWPSNSVPLVVFTDITSQQQEISKLQLQLYRDPLTGEGNRAGFARELSVLDSEGVSDYSILFMDMNGFKAVNDTYGHEAGDILLKVASQRFRDVIGSEAVLARLGGDEFAIIVRGVGSAERLIDLRDQLEDCLAQTVDIGNCLVKVGVAVGFAWKQLSDDDTSTILRQADQNMYERKAFLKARNKSKVHAEVEEALVAVVE